jgi:hypothetical protein
LNSYCAFIDIEATARAACPKPALEKKIALSLKTKQKRQKTCETDFVR